MKVANFFNKTETEHKPESFKMSKKFLVEPRISKFHTTPFQIDKCSISTLPNAYKPTFSKLKVNLRISNNSNNRNSNVDRLDSSMSTWSSFLTIDNFKKQVVVRDPALNGITAHSSPIKKFKHHVPFSNSSTLPLFHHRRFMFDSVFGPDDSQIEICSHIMLGDGLLMHVLDGHDSCAFTFGQNKKAKQNTMFGSDVSFRTFGIAPLSIHWLFKLIEEAKSKIPNKMYSISVSAMEIQGKEEIVRDLLTLKRIDFDLQQPLLNQLSQLKTESAQKAIECLDAALNSRTRHEFSHMLFSLIVYQHNSCDSYEVSRLNFIDFGSMPKTKDLIAGRPGEYNGQHSLSILHLTDVLIALVNGQKRLPYSESKLTNVLRESMGSNSCRLSMISHVLTSIHSYSETLQLLQLTGKIFKHTPRHHHYHSNKRCIRPKSSSISSNKLINSLGKNEDRAVRERDEEVVEEEATLNSLSYKFEQDDDISAESKARSRSLRIVGGKKREMGLQQKASNNHVHYYQNSTPRVFRSSLTVGGDAESTSTTAEIENSSSSEMSCDTIVNRASSSSPPPFQHSQSTSYKSSQNSVFNTPTRGRIRMGTLSSPKQSVRYPQQPSSYYRSASSSNNKTSSSRGKGEFWIDGPRYPSSSGRRHFDLDKEIWIDGPKATNNNQVVSNRRSQNEPIKNCCYHNESRGGFSSAATESSAFTKDITESLERIDRELLNQLNRHDANAKDTLQSTDPSPNQNQSRPISLLSVNSTTSACTATHISTSSTLSADSSSSVAECTRRKLDDLKSSCQVGSSVFAHTLEPMDALHKTLESILNFEEVQAPLCSSTNGSSSSCSSDSPFRMSKVRSTQLYPAVDLFDSTNSSVARLGMIETYLRESAGAGESSIADASLRVSSDDDRRLSRILSPTRIKPSSSIVSNTMSANTNSDINDLKPTSPSGSSSSSSCSSSSSSASLTPPNSTLYMSSHHQLTNSSPYQCQTSSQVNSSSPNTPPNGTSSTIYSLPDPFGSNSYCRNSRRLPQPPTPSSSSTSSHGKRQVTNNRLFFNFASNQNPVLSSLPASPAHHHHYHVPQPMSTTTTTVSNESANLKVNKNRAFHYPVACSVPNTPVRRMIPSQSGQNQNQHPQHQSSQPMLKMLKQKANLVTACGGGNTNSQIPTSNRASKKDSNNSASTSILNRLFSRSRSKESRAAATNMNNQQRYAEIQTLTGNLDFEQANWYHLRSTNDLQAFNRNHDSNTYYNNF